MTNKTIGKYGEQLAKNFLINKGFKILEMNFRYSKLAEIDIIALKDNVIHFVEVKTRKSDIFGMPFEAVNAFKLASIYKCANYYMQLSRNNYKKMQIDAIGIILKSDNEPKIDFLEDISL